MLEIEVGGIFYLLSSSLSLTLGEFFVGERVTRPERLGAL
jgi:hypothetical protein